MESRRFMMLSCVLIPFAAGCVTTGSSVKKNETLQLQEKVTQLEAQLKQQQDENDILKQQVAKAYTDKKEVRMPNGKEIQQALKNAGYYKGDIDGQIGSKTKDAIKKFQTANGLAADGVIGSRTWQLLGKFLESEK